MKTKETRIQNIFGASVKRERLEQSLTQESFAESCGIDRATIQRIEQGSGTTLETAYNIAISLGVPIANLLPKTKNVEDFEFINAKLRFLKSLSLILRMGRSPLRALQVLQETVDNARITKEIPHLIQSLEQGDELHEAFKKGTIFSDSVTVEFLRVGYMNGEISKSLDELCKILRREAKYLEKLSLKTSA